MEIVITYLSNEGFESFTEKKKVLKAYIPKDNYKESQLVCLTEFKNHISDYSIQTIKDQNWNAEWEKHFDPVYVGDSLAILAPFHNQDITHQLKIIIQPQMSFGTGHHQTTWLASKRMLTLALKGAKVLDMGTGTGVLAILAEKLGAASIFAPDIDEWSYRNAIENCQLNNCSIVDVALGTHLLIANKQFDVIIANINKNVLLAQFEQYALSSIVGTKLLISGFFTTDINDLVLAAKKHGFIFEKEFSKDEWALLEFVKQ